MESQFRTDLITWLSDDSGLDALINRIEEEGPLEGQPPTLSIASSASADWSSKSGMGREVRVALELVDRGDQAAAITQAIELIELRIAALSPDQNGYRIVVTQFIRSRAERRPRSLRAVLLEYRFRLLKNTTE
ncbi:tail completion protein gp17 [Erythrobacter sp. W53]|uniref:tail completion protein gp17 n=1 Tax=Erythrobacter sp. W53 TaxID=3425947 RepID=UPI003D769D99